MSLNVTTEVMKGLVQFKPGTFDLEPAIARSWSTSPDGREWTFKLEPGLKFSDGTPVDAEAVKFNFNRWGLTENPYHGTVGYPYYAAMFGGFPGLIADVRTPDDQTVVFTLTRPFSPFLRDLAMPSFAIGSPTAIRNDPIAFASHPVGWGPYTLVEWVKADHITLQANPNYPVHAAYKTVIIRDIPDQATSVLDMQRGDVDMLTDPRPDDAAQLAKQPGLSVFYAPANNTSYLALNMDKAPFGNLAVRQAIAYGIDVRALMSAFYPKGAQLANNWTPVGMLGENDTIKSYPYDPAKAKQLLASAGFAHGFTTSLDYPNIPRPYMPNPQGVALAIKAQLQKIGVNVNANAYDWSEFLRRVRNGEHEMVVSGWNGDNGDPDNFMDTLLDRDSAIKPNSQNYAFWRDERFHDFMLQGQASSDQIRRAGIYREANLLISQQVPAIPFVHVTVPVVIKSSIAGLIPTPDSHVAFEYLRPKR
jgi:peptide/nickel transport system substrate-binding protein